LTVAEIKLIASATSDAAARCSETLLDWLMDVTSMWRTYY